MVYIYRLISCHSSIGGGPAQCVSDEVCDLWSIPLILIEHADSSTALLIEIIFLFFLFIFCWIRSLLVP